MNDNYLATRDFVRGIARMRRPSIRCVSWKRKFLDEAIIFLINRILSGRKRPSFCRLRSSSIKCRRVQFNFIASIVAVCGGRGALVVYGTEDQMTDRDLTNCWLQRARADGTLDATVGGESDAATQVLAVRSRDGWDPWEVWLRHIDQPRRNLTQRSMSHPV
jgi:hypothetical protein